MNQQTIMNVFIGCVANNNMISDIFRLNRYHSSVSYLWSLVFKN